MDKPPEAEEEDPYRRFVALCRKFHGQRTNKGHSFHAKKLRWLWYLSNGKNGAFGGLWTTNGIQRTRYRNDELAITVRCLSGGFTEAETEAVVKAWWEHHGEGCDFMSILVYRATTLQRALQYTGAIREGNRQENATKYWSKTANRILWALEKAGFEGATPMQIASVVERDVETVKHRLTHLCKHGQVEKIRRGQYRIVPEQEYVTAPITNRPFEQEDQHRHCTGETEERADLSGGDICQQRPPNPPNNCDVASQDVSMESVLAFDNIDTAERKIRDRFYQEAREFAAGRSRSCPQNLNSQLAALRSAWCERHVV